MRASEREMRNALEAARQTLLDLGLLELWRESVVERISRGLRRFTWSSNGIRPGLATGDASVKEYLEFLRGVDFTRSARHQIMSKTERRKLHEGQQIHGRIQV